MKEIRIRKLHRSMGILIAPLLVIQTLSGLLLGFGLFRRAGTVADSLGVPILHRPWDQLLVSAHFRPGLISDTYHLLLGAGIIWIAVSGIIIYVMTRGRGKGAYTELPK